MVLPVPGGPYRSMPFGHPSGNRSGRFVGYTIDSRSELFASSSPTTWSHVTSGLSRIMRSSKSFSSSWRCIDFFCSSGVADGSTAGSTPWACCSTVILSWYELHLSLYSGLSLLEGYRLMSFTSASIACW